MLPALYPTLLTFLYRGIEGDFEMVIRFSGNVNQ
jgi:hypothetical protein